MPNHFLTIGLCSRDYSDDEEVNFDDLKDANLCELVGPKLPEELQGIQSSSTNFRYINKVTGEIAKTDIPFSEYNNYERVDLTDQEIKELMDKYGATNWYDWNINKWGTKWGTYETKVHEMGGDGSPILIEFQSAWGPPNSDTMSKITEYLCEKYKIKQIKWMGHDPSCGEVCDI